MSGTHEKDQLVDKKPSQKYIVGTLASRKPKDSESEVDETNLRQYEDEEGRASIRAHRMKVSFLTRQNSFDKDSKIVVTVSGHLYYLKHVMLSIPSTTSSSENTHKEKR